MRYRQTTQGTCRRSAELRLLSEQPKDQREYDGNDKSLSYPKTRGRSDAAELAEVSWNIVGEIGCFYTGVSGRESIGTTPFTVKLVSKSMWGPKRLKAY